MENFEQWNDLATHLSMKIPTAQAAEIDPNNTNTIWVGTGENNNQRSVAYGDGVYVSRDGGKSWTNTGLKVASTLV